MSIEEPAPNLLLDPQLSVNVFTTNTCPSGQEDNSGLVNLELLTVTTDFLPQKGRLFDVI